MLKCARWPGQSGLSCPFWQILGSISSIQTPSCPAAQVSNHSRAAKGANWPELMHTQKKECTEQQLLNVKLAKDHLCCASSHLRKQQKPRFEPFLCYKPRPRLWSPEDWGRARVACSSAPAEHCQWVTLLQLSVKLLFCLLITLFI